MSSKYPPHNLALEQAILNGQPVTRLDSIAVFGVSDLTALIGRIRKKGFIIHSRKITLRQAYRQTRQFICYQPPKQLPLDEIYVTQYWYEP